MAAAPEIASAQVQRLQTCAEGVSLGRSICLESLPSGEKPADRIKKSKGKLTENFALQRNREAFLNIAEEDGLLTKGECLCLSHMNDAQEFVESLVNTVLGKIELMHDLFLYCLEKLRL